MKVYLVTIETEDSETYQYVYKEKPTIKKYKKLFFEDNGENYRKSDWDNCISHRLEEFEVIE